MLIALITIAIIVVMLLAAIGASRTKTGRTARQTYYDKYLKSDAWKRKQYVVLKRDNEKCVYCGAHATQVHHLRYAKNIGKEPIDWLISICENCHKAQHN